jgi:hypothetical protein
MRHAHGYQSFLGEHPPNTPAPKKNASGEWNPPQTIRDEFHRRMVTRADRPARRR